MCLYESLAKHSEDFILHYLCLNDETYNKLNSLGLDNLKCYSMQELSQDADFETLKNNNVSRPIDSSDGPVEDIGQSPFHWSLASFFSGYLVNNYNLPHVLYIDSDIIFYRNVQLVFDAMGSKSIGIITHKHNKLNKTTTNVGYYNVGIVYFANDEVGGKCLDFWRNCCIHSDNEYAATFGSCGDQKYLELFDDLFGKENVEVLCRKVGNGAPWNFPMFEFLEDDRIIWRDPDGNVLDPGEELEQDLVFNHFSHFTPNYDEPSFQLSRGGEWGPIHEHPGVIDVYVDYMQNLLSVKEKYRL